MNIINFLARKKDPKSSKIAGEKMQGSEKQRTNQQNALIALHSNGNGTTAEIADHVSQSRLELVVNKSSFSKRMNELEKAGLISRFGDKKCSVGGKISTVWSITPIGEAAAISIQEKAL